MISTPQKSQGFTIIEAIVSMALFAIAFSGLYFFFGMAQQANNNSEKRMYLNLMGNQILETIHAEAFRGDADVANPFVTPTSYTANLSDCSTYTAPDIRHTWCTELDASIGPHKGVHADELRTVEVIKDETNLIVNVTLVADGGTGSNNLIKTFLSRKIAPPRRAGPSEACVERHNNVVAYIKSEGEACHAGTATSIMTSKLHNGIPPRRYFEISCPSGSDKRWRIKQHFFHASLIGGNMMGTARSSYFMDFFQAHIWDKYRNYPDPNTIYGEGYPWGYLRETGGAGVIEISDSTAGDRNFCRDVGECTVISCPALITAADTMYAPKAICHRGYPSVPPIVNVKSCCPGVTDLKSDGTYKNCAKRPQADPDNYIHYMVEGIDYSKLEGFTYSDHPEFGASDSHMLEYYD